VWAGTTDGKHVISVIACRQRIGHIIICVIIVCCRHCVLDHTRSTAMDWTPRCPVGAAVSWASRKLTRFAGHVAPTTATQTDRRSAVVYAKLRPNSTTRTPATDMLYNTTNGHHQRTSSQQFYNKFATSQCQIDMPRCWEFGMWQIFARWW